jgi:Domain of unknown function (DUF4159)
MDNLRFPAPPIAPLKRLHVYDSLMMNAHRWAIAHEYHRRRQNVHYQSLNQPGIVCGLGVSLTKPPESTRSEFRDDRWIEIQPGIAIDLEGNVIVVDGAIDRRYRIAAKPPITGTITIYVVVSYVEPQPIDHQHPEILQEQVRFDQKTSPPADHEIELCRIQLAANFVRLEIPDDVLFPQVNQLDLSHRLQAQTKPLAAVGMAEVKPYNTQPLEEPVFPSLAFLSQSTPALYPMLQSIAARDALPIEATLIEPYDLLYLAASHLSDLSGAEQDALNLHLKNGGTLFIELPVYNEFAIANLHDWIAQIFHTALTPWHALHGDHPLRSQPFLFAALPDLDQNTIQLWSGGGIVFVAGALSAAWAPDRQLLRSRQDLRTAHELGINILNFAWRRKHLTQLIQID